MRDLFHKDSLVVLESLFFTRSLFAFDFDGTLARIVPSPEDAFMTAETAKLLSELNGKVPVALISGRSIEDLKPRVPFEPRYLIGNHGLEGPFAKKTSKARAEQACADWKRTIHAHFSAADLNAAGIEVEDKHYSLALHFRKSRSKRAVKNELHELIESFDPKPRIIPGKSVINIVPQGGPHKGIALLELMDREGIRNAFYIGDDDTDEDVFSLAGTRIMSARVGRRKSSQAQYFIDRQSDISRVLRTLLQFTRTAAA